MSSRRSSGPRSSTPRSFLPSYGMAEATLAITFVPRETGVRVDVVERAALEAGEALPAGEAPPRGRPRSS